MVDVYPDGKDQFIGDPEWLRRADRKGWVVISKDKSIWHDHMDVLRETSLRLFVYTSANLTGPDMVQRLMANWEAILRRTGRPGPYVYAILPGKLEKRWGPSGTKKGL